MKLFLLTLALICLSHVFAENTFRTEDIFIPQDCDSIVQEGDHVLIEFSIQYSNGTELAYLKRPDQLYHIFVESTERYPIVQNLKGMCKNATRRIIWDEVDDSNFSPIFNKEKEKVDELGISIDLTVVHITTPENYQIFSALREGNTSLVFDLIEAHQGVNAVDEWGQTPLMIAIQMNKIDIISSLLNTRMPKVDVNFVKHSGFTALFYAVEKSSPSIVTALLRRGADPNVASFQDSSKGNTPLHYACLLEKPKIVDALLQFGANPIARNQYGQVPLQLLPADSVRSTKMMLKKLFEDAIIKSQKASEKSPIEAVMNGRNDL